MRGWDRAVGWDTDSSTRAWTTEQVVRVKVWWVVPGQMEGWTHGLLGVGRMTGWIYWLLVTG